MPIAWRTPLTLCMVICSLLIVPLGITHAQNPVTIPDLFFLASDDGGIAQVWAVRGGTTVERITQETSSILSYDLNSDNGIAYVTGRSLVTTGIPVTAGGPLDTPTLELRGVAWSPRKDRVAVVAVSSDSQANPSEGVWFYDINTSAWTLVLNSTRVDPTNQLVYTDVEWSPAGDRLLLSVDFSNDVHGVSLYSISTSRNLPYNFANTTNIIDAAAYSRGNLSLDGTAVILSDLPGLPTGNAYNVNANNYTNILPLVDPTQYANVYLSHAIPIRDGTAFFVRDIQASATTTDVYRVNTAGVLLPLGNLPVTNLGFDADWTQDGTTVTFITDPDAASGLGTVNVYSAATGTLQAVTLPAEMRPGHLVKWGAETFNADRVVQVMATEPLADFLDETGSPFYGVRLQWNSVVGGNGSYRVTVNPGFNGQGSFDVTTVAAKLNRLTCGQIYNISIAAYDSTGTAGPESPAIVLSIPACTVTPAPITTDLYGGATAGIPAAPVNQAPTGSDSTVTGTDTTQVQQPPAASGDAAAKVVDLVASLPIQQGTLANGSPSYYSDLSWSPPAAGVGNFLVKVSPPFGADNRDRLPARFTGTSPILARIEGLACNQLYSVTVENIGEDGFTVLATSDPASVTTPPCP